MVVARTPPGAHYDEMIRQPGRGSLALILIGFPFSMIGYITQDWRLSTVAVAFYLAAAVRQLRWLRNN